MIKTKTEKTVDTVRERERERESKSLEKIGFVSYGQKSDYIDKIKRNKYIEEREIGYVNRCKSYV